MAYKGTVSRRLLTFFRHPDVGAGPMTATTKLGKYFDDVALKGEIRGRMNRSAIGFADVLETQVQRSEIGEGTEFKALVATVVKRSCLEKKHGRCSNTAVAYKKRMRALLAQGAHGRASLARLVQIVAPGTPEVTPETHIPDLLTTTAAIQALRDRVNKEYRKFLMTPTTATDYRRTLKGAQRRVLIRLHR